MKKLIILVILFIILGIVFLVFTLFGKKDEPPPDTMPTPTTIQTNTVKLDSSVPLNNATNVPRNQEIVLTFSQSVTDQDIKILVGPDTGQAVLFRGKTVIIRPIPLWEEGTPYRISIQYADLSRIPDGINFTVAGIAPESLPDTGPNPTAIKESEDLQREARPDVYLSNYTPYETDSFSITSEYKTSPTGHFAFIVIVKNNASESTIRNEVAAWAASHGITETQFNSLDISYQ